MKEGSNDLIKKGVMDTGGRPTGFVAKPKTAHPLPQMAVPFGRRKVQPVRTGAATPVIQG